VRKCEVLLLPIASEKGTSTSFYRMFRRATVGRLGLLDVELYRERGERRGCSGLLALELLSRRGQYGEQSS